MIKEYTLTINKRKSLLNKNLVISTQDKGIDIRFNIMDCDYMNLNSRNLYSQIYIKSPTNTQIESDVCPIINNTVVFTLTNDIMNKLTDEGIYELYIVIIDDKRNTNVLPVVNMTVEQSKFTMKEIQDGVAGSSVIDYARMTSAGNAMNTFNVDKTYNASNWNKGDLITEAKLNKIEACLTTLRDDSLDTQGMISDMRNSQFIKLVGKANDPIIISGLAKGMYVVEGYIMEFTGSAKRLLDEPSYYFVAYSNDKYSRIIRCEKKDQDFLSCRYDKLTSTVYLSQEELVYLNIENGYVGVKTYKNQRIELTTDAEIILPDIDGFAEIDLYVNCVNSTKLTFTNNIYWSSYRTFEQGKMYKITLKYIEGSWLGNIRLYDRLEKEEVITRSTVATSSGVGTMSEADNQDLDIVRDTTLNLPTTIQNKKITLRVNATIRDSILTLQYASDEGSGELKFKLAKDSYNVFEIDCNKADFLITKKSDIKATLTTAEKNSGIRV